MNDVNEQLAAELFLLSQLLESLLTAGEIWEFEGLVDGRDYRSAYEFLEERLVGRTAELGAEASALFHDIRARLAFVGP
jgi:hypothetical protein